MCAKIAHIFYSPVEYRLSENCFFLLALAKVEKTLYYFKPNKPRLKPVRK